MKYCTVTIKFTNRTRTQKRVINFSIPYSAALQTFILCLFLLAATPSAYSKVCDPSLLKRADAGDVNMQSYVAHLYASGKGINRNYKEARYWYGRVINHEKADAKIVAHAQLLLGLMYNSGKGGNQDYSAAMKCFLVAADQGYFDAHISIGHLYAKGLGVKKDLHKALYWWKLAARKGHPKAPNLVLLLQQQIAATDPILHKG